MHDKGVCSGLKIGMLNLRQKGKRMTSGYFGIVLAGGVAGLSGDKTGWMTGAFGFPYTCMSWCLICCRLFFGSFFSF